MRVSRLTGAQGAGCDNRGMGLGVWATWSHRFALLAGLLVSFWAAVETPAARAFELTMRRLGWTGAILGPLDLAWTTVATLALGLVAYALVWVALRLVCHAVFEDSAGG